MAVVENRATEIGDVIRIQTDVPVIGLISLTAFLDNTEGEQISDAPGMTWPVFEPGTRVDNTISGAYQIGEERFSMVYPTSGLRHRTALASLNVTTGVWNFDYPETSVEGGFRLVGVGFHIYTIHSTTVGRNTRQITIVEFNAMTSERREVATTTNDNFVRISDAVDNSYQGNIYYWVFPRRPVGGTTGGPFYNLIEFNTTTNTFRQVTQFPLQGISDTGMTLARPYTPTIVENEASLYVPYQTVDRRNERGSLFTDDLYIYNFVQDTWTLSSKSPVDLSVTTARYLPTQDRIYCTELASPRTKPVIYNPHSDMWTADLSAPDSRFIGSYTGHGDRVYALGDARSTYIYNPDTDSWGTAAGGSMQRLFSRMFRFSTDGGLNFSPFMELTEINIENITVRQKDQFVLEVTYERIGNDATGELAFNSFTISGDFDEVGYPIYDQTAFKRLFEVNDPNVLGWAINVLEKVYQRGLLANYVDRNREDKDDSDFIVFWNSITHLFALLVYFARNFENIAANRTILIEYLNNFDIGVPFDQNLEDLGYIFSNRPDEYRKRGTGRILFTKGENSEGVDGELLRIINKQILDFLLFSLLEAHKVGWCLGESSPTWTGTENVQNLILAYETTQSVNDLSLYPLVDQTNIDLFMDTTINTQVMRISGHSSSGSATGIGFANANNPTRDKLILIDPGISYEISFYVRKGSTAPDQLNFGVYAYNSNLIRINLLPITTSSANQNNFFSQINNTNIALADEYYWFTGVLYAVGTTRNDALTLDFRNGRGLLLTEDIKYIGFFINARDGAGLADLFIYDIKMAPKNLPISQGLFGEKDIIAGYLTNNGELSNENLRLFIQNRLIPYDSFLLPEFLGVEEVTLTVTFTAVRGSNDEVIITATSSLTSTQTKVIYALIALSNFSGNSDSRNVIAYLQVGSTSNETVLTTTNAISTGYTITASVIERSDDTTIPAIPDIIVPPA